MRKFLRLLTVAAFFPTSAFSHALDNQLACETTPHEFVSELAKLQLTKMPASRVEGDSVNAFRLAQGAGLTVFGFRVHAVFGYQTLLLLVGRARSHGSPHPPCGADVGMRMCEKARFFQTIEKTAYCDMSDKATAR